MHKTRGRKSDKESSDARPSNADRLRQIVSTSHATGGDIERALLVGILEEQFGSEVAADPRFSELAQEVLMAVRRDAAAIALLRQCILALTRVAD